MRLRAGLTGAGQILIMMMPAVTAILQQGDVTQF
jgi:hypothetical protein